MKHHYLFKSFVLTALGVAAAAGQDTKPVIDNERVTVWDVTWTKGQANPAGQRNAVIFWMLGGKVAMGSGVQEHQSREASFSAGDEHGTVESGAPRSLVIVLKDHPVPPLENKTGYPAAFPRPHVKKLLENEHVIAWSYRWNPGEPTPMHFHDKDVVVVYLEDTALTSTTPDGAKKLNEYKAFDVRFNKRDRTHTEQLERGTGSAMMLELK